MGLCGSSDKAPPATTEATPVVKEKAPDAPTAQAINRAVDAELKEAKAEEGQCHKLLLLGAGESGKSTLFKQMINIYGKGFTDQDKKSYIPIIYRNTINSIKQLVKFSEELPKRSDDFARCAITDEKTLEAARKIAEYKYDDRQKYPQEIIDAIKLAWADPGIQLTYANRSQFQLVDGTKHFLDHIDQWIKADYLPSKEDILRCRVRTTGIVESEFAIDNNKFKMVDVGGQRNERKKWMHCFDGVTALLFVAAISEYDQMLYEDENIKRMDEALMLFENICNSRWFRDTSVILFLNKCDLFREKLKKVPLKACFADYDGADTYEAGCQFMEKEFLKRNHFKKAIYCHVTCATDERNVKVVFNGVKDIVIRTALDGAGLV